MKRAALHDLQLWHQSPFHSRKPLVLRGARQVGKSFLVRDFCARQKLRCLEINFEKTPSLRQLFVEGDNSRTIALLEVHFGQRLDAGTLLFLDEIQEAPEVFARLRYFHEESPSVAVAAAGSLLEFALADLERSVPVGRIGYLHLGPMRFEEFLEAREEHALLGLIRAWRPGVEGTAIPEIFHRRLLEHVRDFSWAGGMPEAVARLALDRDPLACGASHRSILETYRQDFGKYRKRIPWERIEKVFVSIPSQVGKKWVHARVNPGEKAQATDTALDALCKARVAHRIFHSAGNGVPLEAEAKERSSKVLFLDVGLLSAQLGLRMTDLLDPALVARVNEGAIAEQWIGQHLLDLRPIDQEPRLHYWVREKKGALAEVDYLWAHGPEVYPVEVKAGSTARAKSLQVFLSERPRSKLAIQFSTEPAFIDEARRTLRLPYYLVEQLERIVSSLQ